MKARYIIRGKVKVGANRGKRMGFPTANIPLHKKIPEGIYVSTVSFDNKEYMAATFIGSAKTFSEKDYKAEAYILNFKDNLYGKWIRLKLYKKLRANKKFNTQQKLVAQMKKDVLDTSLFFKRFGNSINHKD